MQRLTTEWAVSLTYRTEDDSKDILTHVKALLSSIRHMANAYDWKYDLRLIVSKSDPDTGEEARPHLHMYIIANPGSTVIQWLNDYWYSRHGTVDKRKCYDVSGWWHYMDKQAEYEYKHKSAESIEISTIYRAGEVENNSNYVLDIMLTNTVRPTNTVEPTTTPTNTVRPTTLPTNHIVYPLPKASYSLRLYKSRIINGSSPPTPSMGISSRACQITIVSPTYVSSNNPI